MKKILLALAILSVAFPAIAQRTPGVYTLGGWNGGTNNIAATSTNTHTDVIACSDYDHVGYQITVRPVSTSTGTVVFKFADTLDSTTYESTPSRTVTVTLDGTNAVTAIGDFSIPNTAALKFAQSVSTNAMAMTNVVIKLRFKEPKRGS